MKRLLDTDICIHLIRGKHPRMRKRVQSYLPGDLVISSITLAELSYGAELSAHPARNHESIAALLSYFKVADFDPTAALEYGALRARLASKGQMIGSNDLFIAAHALALGLPLVTGNQKEFARVSGLKLETWG